MTINSKQKGSSFELKVAKMLTEWSGEEFRRTPMSGALHWENDTRVVSDIVPSQVIAQQGWPFSIEAKKVEYPWEISSFLEGTALFWKHWEQCLDDAKRENMIPMLVFSKNYRDTYMALTQKTFNFIGATIKDTIKLDCNDYNLVVMKLSDFLGEITCEKLLGLDLLKNCKYL